MEGAFKETEGEIWEATSHLSLDASYLVTLLSVHSIRPFTGMKWLS